MADQTTIENERALNLMESRKNDETSAVESPAATGPRVEMFDGGLMLGVAALNDLADYMIIGSIPVVGDIMDGIVWFSIYVWIISRGLDRPQTLMWSGAIEIIPLGDLLPTYTAMVAIIILYNNNPQFKALFA